MKTNIQKTILSGIVILVFFAFFVSAFAQEPSGYVVLAPLPGIGGGEGTTPVDLGTYLKAIFNLSIGIAAVLAFIVITYGGFLYATTDALAGKSEGKGHIENGIYGLLLVIGAWLILYTINPQILNFSLALPRANIDAPKGAIIAVTAGTPMTTAEKANDAEIRARLANAGFTFNNPMCATQYQTSCTNVNDLPEGAIQTLITLIGDCRCAIEITGGTETNRVHRTHGPGKTSVDITGEGLKSWFEAKGFLRVGGTAANVSLSNGRVANFIFEKAGVGNSTGDHWHMF